MDRLSVQRLMWGAHRHYLRHGMVAMVAVAGLTMLLALSVATIWSHLRLSRAEQQLSQRMDTLRALSRPQARREKVAALPLPAISERFDLNRRLIATLKATGLEPERIRFKFESVPDAGLTRQVAVFTLKARWNEIASALERMQSVDRALYLSRLRVSRENPGDDQVSAEVQLAVAMIDDTASPGGGR